MTGTPSTADRPGLDTVGVGTTRPAISSAAAVMSSRVINSLPVIGVEIVRSLTDSR